MKAFSVLLIACLTVWACKEAKPETEAAKGVPRAGQLTVMQGYPEDLQGCSCAFSRNREEYDQQQFIYLEKYGMADSTKNFKVISLDGVPVRWYSREAPAGFDLEIQYDSERRTDLELREIRGRLILRFSSGDKAVSPIFGYCGC